MERTPLDVYTNSYQITALPQQPYFHFDGTSVLRFCDHSTLLTNYTVGEYELSTYSILASAHCPPSDRAHRPDQGQVL